jgi:uncharacterized membrane protein
MIHSQIISAFTTESNKINLNPNILIRNRFFYFSNLSLANIPFFIFIRILFTMHFVDLLSLLLVILLFQLLFNDCSFSKNHTISKNFPNISKILSYAMNKLGFEYLLMCVIFSERVN